ncbi:MAG: hypothetical protein ACF8PG_00380 [Maioricimonas sp. JB045]
MSTIQVKHRRIRLCSRPGPPIDTAKPGDVVTFKIHFENVGGRELYEVRIVDNLTPRLQYIEGSASSELDGRVNIEDNGEGSQILTFELFEPLEGKTSGTVTFECRVR